MATPPVTPKSWKAAAWALGGSVAFLASVATISQWVAPGWSPGGYLRDAIRVALRGAVAVLTFAVPAWAILIVAALAVLVIQRAVRSTATAATEAPAPPEVLGYVRDRMFGVDWQWRLGDRGPFQAVPLCPFDANELHYAADFRWLALDCGLCKRKWRLDNLDGHSSADHFGRQEIRRRLRTGEWHDAAERLKAPPEEPSRTR